jgi:hypothetical protein
MPQPWLSKARSTLHARRRRIHFLPLPIAEGPPGKPAHIFVENPNDWHPLSHNGHRLESQRGAIVALHNLLNALS